MKHEKKVTLFLVFVNDFAIKKSDQGLINIFTTCFCQSLLILRAKKMKVICVVICCIAFVLIPTAISSSFTILNSIGKDCETDTGECIEVCEYEDFKLRAGTGKK